MKKALVFWVEKYFYNPNLLQKLLSYLLLPLSWLYCFIMYLRFRLKRAEDFDINIISVGNLTVGGSGKTPLVTALAQKYAKPAVILRGYGRKSSGMIVVKDENGILCDVDKSGDEAMIYAKKLSHAVVIVSENRKTAIHKAKELGCEVIFLDDAYSKHNIKKKDILIHVETQNNFCLPSGPYRERLWQSKEALIVQEGIDFTREVHVQNPTQKMSLVTAIARPQRLDEYLPPVIAKHYFEDHHNFTKEELEAILQKDKATSLLVTFKDYVKMETFGLPLSLLDLEVKVKEDVVKKFVF
ncbi:tetraacyldisaccharide 4'-kinase [Sulfurimonas autotrophica]|uniref:Tetraacyldisaccharide 4'-kinase n=1 Tax=Sulfurimonas autotrophica (strain ATCC BAA-671 / DSM 16294 / JCM 11897 / OK10) TaxID=563040 RepID=E0URK2_SULAO|nr:tetraacyldisaccharide 4'-kinase [Sulfurimonas autotrophica]ADN08946.1 lipid-A-disaccharide kinase [Sulfurimonas autotrophica DSM 16294]